MGDTLSQAEIDSLLNALSSGEMDVETLNEAPEKPVSNYDFAKPSKFSRDHLRTLEIIFENYGRLLSTNLPAYFRKSVQVEVMNAEANTYSEFSNALSNPVLLGVLNFAPLSGNVIIELAVNLGFTIVDRMLGGFGNPLEKDRDFTEIELVIEMTAIITMNIKIGDVEGLMNICIPYTCVEKVIDKLNTKYWYSAMKADLSGQFQDSIQDIIDYAKIPVRAMLGRSSISVNDFANLQVGDIIKLDTKVDDELDVYVGNIKKFTALPGATSKSYAIRVTSIIREEQ